MQSKRDSDHTNKVRGLPGSLENPKNKLQKKYNIAYVPKNTLICIIHL